VETRKRMDKKPTLTVEDHFVTDAKLARYAKPATTAMVRFAKVANVEHAKVATVPLS